MAVIQKIRNNWWLLLVVLAFPLIGFLLMDAQGPGGGGPQYQARNVGTINGTDVDNVQLQNRVDQALNDYRISTNSPSVDDATTAQLTNKAWDDYINEVLRDQQSSKLGLTVSDREQAEKYNGPNIDPLARQFFTNQQGQFDPTLISQFLSNQQNYGPEVLQLWDFIKRSIRNNRKDDKYQNLIKKAYVTPSWMATADNVDKSKTANIKYIKLPLTDVPDADITVSDADLSSFLSANKSKYEQDASRSIEYVSYKVAPSAEDSSATAEWINKARGNFQNSTDDKAFLELNSEIPYTGQYFTENQLRTQAGVPYRDGFMNDPVGTISTPFMENGAYMLYKVMDKKAVPDSVKAKHILLSSTKYSQERVLKMVDSLKQVISNGGDFTLLAAQYSDDSSNSADGGSLGFFGPGRMVQQFNDTMFYASRIGDLKTVFTQFGAHIVKVEDIRGSNPAAKLGFLAKLIEPSSKTERGIYQNAMKFASENRSGDKFDAAVAEQTITTNKVDNFKQADYTLGTLSTGGEIKSLIKWAFDSKVGAVSSVFSMDNEYIVAKVTDASSKGLPSVNSVRETLEAAVRADKKKDILAAKLNGQSGTLEAIASAAGGTVAFADGVTMSNPSISGIGREPLVQANAFGVGKGQKSGVIKGETGVYMIEVTEVIEAEVAAVTDVTKNSLNNTARNAVGPRVFEALKEASNVEDNRLSIY